MRISRRALILLGASLLGWALLYWARPREGGNCYLTGGDALRVCHDARDEGVLYKPGPLQLGYNTQIVALKDGRYAVVMHAEAQDLAAYHARTGRMRPGDSIKSGVITNGDPFQAPPMDFRIWGNLTDPASPLYDALDDKIPAAVGMSGGGNPMLVEGQPGDPFFYLFFLGVTSDDGRAQGWRNVLLEARTRDFLHFDLLQDKPGGGSDWAAFSSEAVKPALVRDSDGRKIASNWPGSLVTPANARPPGKPAGAVPTQGLLGSIVKIGAGYMYFYTDEDPDDRGRDHLFVRTATDLTRNNAWSAARTVLATPPEILVRVAKARGMQRWAVIYTCLRSAQPPVFDLCLQYTENMNLSGPGSLGDLSLYDGPVYNGVSRFALGLAGQDSEHIRAQHFYLSDTQGNLAPPPGEDVGGMLTWNELPRNLGIFGAPTNWATWRVTPAP